MKSSPGMRYFRLAGAVVVGVLAGYLVILGTRSAESGLRWHEMDFNHDGTTSLGEFLEAGDVNTRPVVRNGRRCTEYFLLKDGMPVKVSCPAG